MSKKRVFFDLDGVLVDFIQGVHKAFARPYHPADVTDWFWYKQWGLTTEEVAERCTIDFWKNLKWMPDGRTILHTILQSCPAKDVFLTSVPMDNIESYAGKMIWVDNNMGHSWLDRLFITKSSKAMFAQNRDCLLVDDNEKNCLEFEQAGGSSILVPLYHNRLRSFCSQRIQIVQQGLENWFHNPGGGVVWTLSMTRLQADTN